MPKRPELVVTVLAIWRLGAVHVPLFTAFARGAITLRVESAAARPRPSVNTTAAALTARSTERSGRHPLRSRRRAR